jgi:transposase
MDMPTHSAQARRLDVVETGRRRRWSGNEKQRIVLESLQGPRQASSTARRYSRDVVPDDPGAASPGVAGKGRMVVVLGNGRRVIVDAGVDTAALARVIEVLERR